MANRRLANSIARQLREIDERIYNEYMKHKPNNARVNTLEHSAINLLKSAKSRGIKMIRIPVADGYCFYWETHRTTKLVTFEWLYGGGDRYINPFGTTVLVPIAQANKLIKQFNPKELLNCYE